ncbi:MAG TPA: class I SAM-dependent methyltransferase [Caldilineaceae bacterium]|nr:class I SAM-dependent methyltransferase [Caldilineaceae bacterium]
MPTVLPPPDEKPVYVNRMFARIAGAYDLMNRLMTGGQDQRWRRLLLALCDLPAHGRLLDVGTGTGDIAFEARRRYPGVEVVGVDFTYEMMAVGRRKAGKRGRPSVPFVQGDTLALPFASNSFDAVVSGFLLRNVVDRVGALREQARVAKPGGRVVVLETTPPANTPLGWLFTLYFFRLVPLVGGLVSGDWDAYRYLPHSTVAFPMPEGLRRLMEQAGLVHVFYRELMMGSVAIHVGTKVGA